MNASPDLLRAWLHRSALLPAWLVLLVLLQPFTVSAQEPGPYQASPAKSPPIQVGVTGHYRIGSWTAIQVDPDVGGRSDATLIETIDGEGTRTVYRHGYRVTGKRFGYCVPGSEAAPLIVRGTAEDATGVRTRFPELGPPAEGPALVPLDMPWVVVFGDPLELPTVGANELLGRSARVAVSVPASATDVPDSPLGFDGVDLMVINGSGRELLKQLNPGQQRAVQDWVLGGGKLLLGLGSSAPKLLEAAPWLFSLLPLQREQLDLVRMTPLGFETYLSSQAQLGEFEGARLPDNVGNILVAGRTTRRESVPFASEYVAGLGRVIAVAVDLDQPPMARWPDRLELIERLTGNSLVREDDLQQSVNRAHRYDDLAGQARNTLDRFPVHRPFSFSLITLILAGLVVLIGPLDYLLINRVLGRPLVGWLTFPLVAILLSMLLVYQAEPDLGAAAKGDPTLRRNRLEIVDIDAVSGIGNGFSWTYLYSHPARRVDIEPNASKLLSSVSGKLDHLLVAPFGWPGAAFGGIQIAGEDSRMPPYEVNLHRPVEQDESASGGGAFRSSLHALPLAPRSSKSFATRLRFEPKLQDVEPIVRRRGTDLLEGSFTNPLPFDLLDGMLVYRNWAYLFPTRLPARARVESVETLRQKNFRWQLARQRAIEDSTAGGVWNPAENDNPLRIAEMLMFHSAAGGSRYTTLGHAPLSFLDRSSLLTDNLCMIVGRVAEPLTKLTVKAASDGEASKIEADAAHSPEGESLTMVRVILPVTDSPSGR